VPAWLDGVWRDVRHAIRGLTRAPAFAAIAIATLALGIGVNTALFSVVNSLMLRALPVDAPEQLALVSTREAIQEGHASGWDYAIWDQFRQRRDLFDGAVAWTVFPQRPDLSLSGERQPVDGLFVSGNFFDELGVHLLAGRGFTAAEDRLSTPEARVAVISYGFWQRHFGGAANVIGQQLSVNHTPVTVVGVTPPAFFGPEVGRAFDVALPIGAAPAVLNEPQWAGPAGRSYLAVGVVENAVDQSLRADAFPTLYQPLGQFSVPLNLPDFGLSVRAASGSPVLLARSVSSALTAVDPNLTFSLRPLAEQVSAARHQERLVAWLAGFFGALALLLAAIGLHGVTSYSVERRRAEIGIRMALGAQRRDVIGLALGQTTIMMLGGVAVGVSSAAALTRYLQTLLFGVTPLDPVTFVAAPLLLAAVALLACYLPARRAATIDPMIALRCE
jgi:hypothetical protein